MRVVLLPRIGEDIGLGHLQRCVTLARALRRAGHRPALIIDLPTESSCGTIRSLVPDGIEVARTVDEAFGGASCATSGEPRRIAWAVVDDYAADATADRVLRRSAERVLVLDDHASSARDADVLLSQALTLTECDFAGLVPAACRVLTGPRFALIRPEFSAHSRESMPRARRSGIHNLFVSMGGTDARGLLVPVLRALAGLKADGRPVVHVMISTLSRTVDQLSEVVEEVPYECVVHRDLRDPVGVMAGCDAAVTAGGMTSFELVTLGVPVVIVPSTQLEAGVARVLAQQADAHVIDTDAPNWERELLRTLETIGVCSGDAVRPSVLDAGGAERVVRVMESLTEDAGHA